jgi:hypothetical protein
MRGVARPSKLTDQVRSEVERELALGTPVVVAAQRSGISPRTLSRWLAAGLVGHRPPPVEPTTPKLDLEPGDDDSIDARLRAAEPGLVAVVLESARRGSWQAAAFLLERSNPARWARPPARATTEPAGASRSSVFDEVDAFRRRRRGLPSEGE